MKDRTMNTQTRTAPAVPAKAVGTEMIHFAKRPSRFADAGRRSKPGAQRRGGDGNVHDFGPISRAEMRQIVLEMIG